jgi:hypothetical protein
MHGKNSAEDSICIRFLDEDKMANLQSGTFLGIVCIILVSGCLNQPPPRNAPKKNERAQLPSDDTDNKAVPPSPRTAFLRIAEKELGSTLVFNEAELRLSSANASALMTWVQFADNTKAGRWNKMITITAYHTDFTPVELAKRLETLWKLNGDQTRIEQSGESTVVALIDDDPRFPTMTVRVYEKTERHVVSLDVMYRIENANMSVRCREVDRLIKTALETDWPHPECLTLKY